MRRIAVIKAMEEHALQRVYEEHEGYAGRGNPIKAAQAHGMKTLLASGGFTHAINYVKPSSWRARLTPDRARGRTWIPGKYPSELVVRRVQVRHQLVHLGIREFRAEVVVQPHEGPLQPGETPHLGAGHLRCARR